MENKKNFKNKIIIGTAHFGMPYGLKQSKDAFTSNKEIKKILTVARNNNILTLDTARKYGIAEKKLGNCGVNDFKITSKIYIDKNVTDLKKYIYSQIEMILSNLKVGTLHSLLVHNPSTLLDKHGKQIYNHLLNAKKIYKIKKIGISAHDFCEIKPIINNYKIEIIQLPFNLFDQRILKNKLLDELKYNKIEIHARSIFLQGLLLFSIKELPEQFLQWKHLFKKFDSFVKNYKISKLEACISYVNSFKEIDKFVIGIKNSMELEKIASINLKKIDQFPSFFLSEDLSLIDPSNWEKSNFSKKNNDT